jgi:hypothetical protein
MNYKAFRRVALALGVSSVVILTAVTSYGAQTAPRGLPESPPSQDQNDGQYGAAPPQASPQGQRGALRPFQRRSPVERRLEYLHGQLRIRANQERLWNDFAAAVRDQAQQMRTPFQDFRPQFGNRRDGRGPDRGARRDDGRRGEPTVIERLERRERALDEQRQGLDRMLATLSPLYAALDETQRRIADDEFFRPNRMRNRFFRHFNRDGASNVDGLRLGDGDRGTRDQPGPDRDRDSGANTF